MNKLTERQAKAWPEYIARLSRHYPFYPDLDHWDINYRAETRPGRGHHICATFCDGEVFAQITMDPYGNGSESIAYLKWIHSSNDEECKCEYCTIERDDEEPTNEF